MRRLPEPSARVGNRQFSSLVPREAFNNPLQLRSPMTFNRNLEPLVECVAEHTVGRDMESEDWQKAVALNGLLELEDETYHETVLEFVNRSIETQTSTGQFSYGSLDPRQRPDYAGDWYTGDMSAGRQIGHHVNPAALGPAVLDMYERTGEADYLEAARRQYQYLRDIKRVDGAIPQHGENELWLDSAYMLCPFFSRYGSVCDDQTLSMRQRTKYAHFQPISTTMTPVSFATLGDRRRIASPRVCFGDGETAGLWLESLTPSRPCLPIIPIETRLSKHSGLRRARSGIAKTPVATGTTQSMIPRQLWRGQGHSFLHTLS